MRPTVRVGTLLLGLWLVATACTGGTGAQTQQTLGTSGSPSGPGSPSSPLGSALPAALVRGLPDGCVPAAPPSSATIAFAASGRAWAVSPDGTGLTCLFEADDPGSFQWGPRVDRVAIGGLQVLGVGSRAAGPSLSLHPSFLAWGRPTGLSLVFPSPDGKALDKVIVGSSRVMSITPLAGRTYSDVVYHASGLAISFVTAGPNGSEIDVSSNTGTDPKRLVFSSVGTIFGPLAFDSTGGGLFYAAKLKDGTRMLSNYGLVRGRAVEKLWVGSQDVLKVLPNPHDTQRMALTVGSGCGDSTAVFSALDGTAGTPILPGAGSPTAALGWLDDDTILVAAGGCGAVDLWAAPVTAGGAPTLVVSGVDPGAVRVADPTPPPKLPPIGVTSGFG